jgi:hypothetical protein
MLHWLSELFPFIQNSRNIKEYDTLVNTHTGWVQFKEYNLKNNGIKNIIQLRYAYSKETFNQNFVDIIYTDENIINSSSKKHLLFIVYLCDESLPLKENVKILLEDYYLIGNFYSSVEHHYLSHNYWKSFNISLPPKNHKIKDYSTNRLLIKGFSQLSKFSYEGGLRTEGLMKTSYINKPLISIITTVFNNADFLEQTIQSVINQTYENIEYIIIDAGSTDGTVDVLKKYSHYIDYYVSEKDNGIYHGMDKGIRLSNGNYIIVLNSDDLYFRNNIVEQLAQSIITFPDIDFFYGSIYVVRKNRQVEFKESSIDGILYKNRIPHPTIVVRKSSYLRVGGFNLKYKISADYDLVLKLLLMKCNYKKLHFNRVIFRDGGYSAGNPDSTKEYESILKEKKLLSVRLRLNILSIRIRRKVLKFIRRIK